MNIRYYVDLDTGHPHIYNHNVSEKEIEDVLSHPGEDRVGKEGSRVAIGQTKAGRYLRIIYVPDSEPNNIFIITAFALKGKTLMVYKKRRRIRKK